MRTPGVLTGRPVGEQPIHLDVLQLAFRVLVETTDPDEADALTVRGVLLACKVSGRNP